MRLALLLAVAVLAACGSQDHGSRILTKTGRSGEAPAGQRAGGPATLVRQGSNVVGKGLLVVRVRGSSIVVRNPKGGTLTVTHRHPAGTQAVASPGEHVSFRGALSGTTVTASSVTVLQSR
jgi:hypothetical protein